MLRLNAGSTPAFDNLRDAPGDAFAMYAYVLEKLLGFHGNQLWHQPPQPGIRWRRQTSLPNDIERVSQGDIQPRTPWVYSRRMLRVRLRG